MSRTDMNRRSLKAAAWMVPVAFLTYWFAGSSPSAPSRGYARRAIPVELQGQGTWFSQGEHELSDRAIQILRTNDYLLRNYLAASGKGTVELCIVFAKDNRTAIHPPEVCLQGEGSQITGQQVCEIQLDAPHAERIQVRELAIESRGRVRLYWYAYKVGPTFTVSFVSQQWLIWWNGLLRRPVGGALIRLSTGARRRDLADARQRLTRFAASVFPHIITKLRLQASDGQ